ncbi:MAG: hypothetical protein IPP35_04125 [Elusimicrobia bacterium]|nr:hypothetical protein [Elusimicrobiota bacterium]
MRRIVPSAVLLAGVLVLAGCQNNNLFGGLHKEGTGDAQSLVSDGQSALARGEYATAQDYFTRAIAADPGNSDALYGSAVAAMGLAGLNIGQLVSNLTTDHGGSGAPSLRGAIQQASLGLGAPSGSSDSLLFEIGDKVALDDALKVVIRNLETIHLGLADGKIARDDASLLINLGLARLLKGVTGPWRSGLLDIRETGGAYSVVLTGSISGSCVVIDDAIHHVAWGFLDLNEAVGKLKLVSGSTLADITSDVDTLYTTYHGQVSTDCPSVPATRLAAGVPSSPGDRL